MVSAPHSVKMKSSTPVESRQSLLLSKEENEQIFRLLGQKCQSLATAVIQLFTTSPPDHMTWYKRDSGVLCLVKDNAMKSYFFRMYCPKRLKCIWEQQVYFNIEYKSPYQYFHTFEAENCVAAFNFASEEEAQIFKNALLEKLTTRQRREVRRSRISQGRTPPREVDRQIQQPQPGGGSSATWTGGVSNGGPASHHRSNSAGGHTSQFRSEKKRRHLTKADIGLPLDFKHVTHVGWDPQKGFDIDNADENLNKFLSKAGVSENQLRDKETREFIYDFINTHGGLEAVKEELGPSKEMARPTAQVQPPPVPMRATNQQQLQQQPQQTHHQQQQQQRAAPPPPPARIPRTPAPTAHSTTETTPSRPARPVPPVLQQQHMPSPSAAPVPPPPPPPPPIMEMAPQVPAESTAVGKRSPAPQQPDSKNDTRSALLESIRSGKVLKHVEVERKPSTGSTGDSRNDLLSEIRQGIELKAVDSRQVKPSPSLPSHDGLAGALARALADRNKAIHSDSDTDDSDEAEDEDDWE